MRSFVRTSLAVVLATIGSLACSSTPSRDDVCADYVATLGRCLAPYVYLEQAYFDERRRACLVAFETPGSAMTPESVARATLDTPCAVHVLSPERAFGLGRFSDGESCIGDFQCASGHCRRLRNDGESEDGACGVCTPVVAAGGACSRTDRCEGDAPCMNAVCGAPGSPESSSCPLFCGTARGAPGAPCTSTDDCKLGLRCDEETATCVVPPRLAPPGAPCGNELLCEIGFCTEGTCPAPLEPGAPCDNPRLASSFCAPGTRCVHRRCQAPTAASCR